MTNNSFLIGGSYRELEINLNSSLLIAQHLYESLNGAIGSTGQQDE